MSPNGNYLPILHDNSPVQRVGMEAAARHGAARPEHWPIDLTGAPRRAPRPQRRPCIYVSHMRRTICQTRPRSHPSSPQALGPSPLCLPRTLRFGCMVSVKSYPNSGSSPLTWYCRPARNASTRRKTWLLTSNLGQLNVAIGAYINHISFPSYREPNTAMNNSDHTCLRQNIKRHVQRYHADKLEPQPELA